jgi:SOS response regulatory protein OraA/RecX
MPVVTNIIKRRRKSWVEVFADGQDSLLLPAEQLPSWIEAGAQLPDELWTQMTAASEYEVLLDTALRMLGRREHFVAELRRKLGQRQRDRAVVQRVIDKCAAERYVDDRRAAEQLTQALVGRGGIGRMKLRGDLLQRGCAKELAEEMVGKHGGSIDEGEEVAQLLAGKRKLLEGKMAALRRRIEQKEGDPRKVKMQLRGRLGAAVGTFVYARGFTSDEARAAAQRFTRELLDDEGFE